jgi:uncharacterized protein with von Willebrand factor type A (vWA) domain
MTLYRYSRWDGSQEEELSSQELIDRLSDQILDGDSLRSAMRRLMERGTQLPNGRRMMGMRELMDRLKEQRQRSLDRYNLSSMMDDIQQRLDDIVDTERSGIQGRLDELGPDDDEAGQSGAQPSAEGAPQGGEGEVPPEMRELLRGMADRRLSQLNALPPDAGGRVQQLRDYDFMDPEARRKFDELLDELQKQVLQNYFQGIQQGIQNMTEEDLRRVQEMVRDLNELTKRALNGEDPDISDFMRKWGEFFPPGIETFDQLREYMEKQMSQMQTLLNSMSSEQRNELQDMMDALLRDNRLQWDLFELSYNMARLNPEAFDNSRFSLTGDEPLSLQEALRLMGDLSSMDETEEQLRQAIRSNDPSHLDEEQIGRLLGEESRAYAQELKRLIKELEDAGFITRDGRGMELTPKAIRRIGERALENIFRKMRAGKLGDHDQEKSGIGIEMMDETKPWVFGDPFHLNTQKTVANAVMRQGPGTPVRITPQDFEINHTVSLTQSSTVIALDMSYSMMWSGYFQAGQRVGLALDTLIRTKYPKDNVTVLAFSYFVLPLDPKMLLDTHWIEYGGGTNLQEVLRYARQHLQREGGTTKQIVLITDGHPTTYTPPPGDWQTGFEENPPDMLWGRSRRRGGVVEETLREVVRCTRDGITINTFMLDNDPALLDFVKMMSKINRGRAFIASPDQLGDYVVADYLTMRNSVVR